MPEDKTPQSIHNIPGLPANKFDFNLKGPSPETGETAHTRAIGTLATLNTRAWDPTRPASLRAELAKDILDATNSAKKARVEYEKTDIDPLTGLKGKKTFRQDLERFINHASNTNTRTASGKINPNFALAIVDLEGFKAVNDTFGHLAGDEILRNVGDRLRSGIRREDGSYRLGGDEFGLLLASVDQDQADQIIKKLRATMQAPVSIDGQDLRVGASIGVIHVNDYLLRTFKISKNNKKEEIIKLLLDAADQRMYADKAKNGGSRTELAK